MKRKETILSWQTFSFCSFLCNLLKEKKKITFRRSKQSFFFDIFLHFITGDVWRSSVLENKSIDAHHTLMSSSFTALANKLLTSFNSLPLT